MNITIIDYGMGNIKSLYNAINFLDYNVKVSRNKKEILKSDFVFLPGVGAFKEAIFNINKYHLIDPLNEYIFDKKKIYLVFVWACNCYVLRAKNMEILMA